MRPYQYKKALEINGWNNIEIKAIDILDDKSYDNMKNHLDNDFIENKNQMNHLSTWICATKD